MGVKLKSLVVKGFEKLLCSAYIQRRNYITVCYSPYQMFHYIKTFYNIVVGFQLVVKHLAFNMYLYFFSWIKRILIELNKFMY